ncbi:uncharacterized protein G2W53_035834 [Senna tora]|uniref:Uncharacterized protein n=1 Tax=Senna tora TaxID=362788 RepID=A0A834W7Z9_9FABA|nr:uncharacterized protein G2W53_035834 [Senna tora]
MDVFETNAEKETHVRIHVVKKKNEGAEAGEKHK